MFRRGKLNSRWTTKHRMSSMWNHNCSSRRKLALYMCFYSYKCPQLHMAHCKSMTPTTLTRINHLLNQTPYWKRMTLTSNQLLNCQSCKLRLHNQQNSRRMLQRSTKVYTLMLRGWNHRYNHMSSHRTMMKLSPAWSPSRAK